MKDIILEAVNHEYLLEIKDKILGFLNQTPADMLTHLWNCGGALDFADMKTLLSERDGEWDPSKVPQIYFNWVEKAIQGLTRAGINSDLNEQRNMALYFLKASGELKQPFENGNKGQRVRRRGKKSRLSFQRSTQKKISRTNLPPRIFKWTWSRSKPKQRRPWSKKPLMWWRRWCPSSKMKRRNPVVSWMMRKRKSKKKGARSKTMHLSVSTVERSTQPKQRRSAGS